ncbi:hypothetical protein BN2475_1300013 [Paraburkholderia ribeironis]|uniref:Uncharacterized protein n=1 Tax=Paraburkholderia ribeironis TaxID=1247936 RepID=A0A1N7SP97_9BURK|nr:hypothetical protein BN2475_1300013 [Paraburkholderia ribeironis]
MNILTHSSRPMLTERFGYFIKLAVIHTLFPAYI